jgi:hypothetical protein
MPPRLLLPHLASKFWQANVVARFAADDKAAQDAHRPQPRP